MARFLKSKFFILAGIIVSIAPASPAIEALPSPGAVSIRETLTADPSGAIMNLLPRSAATNDTSPTAKPLPPSGLFVHLVRPGQNLVKISSMYRVDLKQMVRLNGISEDFAIKPGLQLLIPEESISQKVGS